MKFLRCLLFVCMLAWSVYPFAQEKRERFTMMGLGDSITEGGDSFTSYLFPLWQMLYSAGYQFDFIGPRESKCRIGTLSHSGFSGKNIEYIDSKIDSLYRLYPADIVLLHAGHNHFSDERPVKGIVAAHKSVIRKLQKINPDVRVLVAQVIPSGKLPKYSYIPELNTALAKMVSELHSDHVCLVNQAEGFDWHKHTVADKVHPNRSGAEKMAAMWFESIKKIYSAPQKAHLPEIIKYKDIEGGDSLVLHIFKPGETNMGEKRATIVYFFGGGWRLGTPMQFYRECARYASEGMVAVSVDYRIGYLHQSTPLDSFEDAKDAIRWLRKNAGSYNIDPNKIVVAGASAGGQLAGALGTSSPKDSAGWDYKPDLMLLYYPVLDLVSKNLGLIGEHDIYKNISPIYNITEYTPPALFVIGLEDHITSVEMAECFKNKMLLNGVKCELHIFERAGHPIFFYRKPLTDDYYEIQKISDSYLKRNGFL